MSHAVESMFSVKETPWHKLGKIVSSAPSAEDAIKLAGLDWTVSSRKVYVQNPDGSQTEAENNRAIVRDLDNKMYGIMSDNYTPLQNSEAFSFFNPFIESGLASFETAGSLKEGRNVWVLARLNKQPIEISSSVS